MTVEIERESSPVKNVTLTGGVGQVIVGHIGDGVVGFRHGYFDDGEFSQRCDLIASFEDVRTYVRALLEMVGEE